MVLGYTTRREFDALSARVNTIDQGGTRGMSVVQTQVGELIKDVSALQSKIESHELAHVAEARQRDIDRREARRYALTTIIAAIATLIAVMALLFTHVR